MPPQGITHGPDTPFDRYAAIIAQAGAAAPTATILTNQLGGVPVLARTGAGVYTFTLAGVFTLNKTFALAQLGVAPAAATACVISVVRTSSDVLTISVVDAAGVAVDLVGSMFLEVQIYSS